MLGALARKQATHAWSPALDPLPAWELALLSYAHTHASKHARQQGSVDAKHSSAQDSTGREKQPWVISMEPSFWN